MKWTIAAIGKPSLDYAKRGISEYATRLSRYQSVELRTDWKESGSAKNSANLLAATEGTIRIALDERGELWSTSQFATHVQGWQLAGAKRVACLIGGADGHDEQLRQQCDHVLALSRLTLQHELALLVLYEQIYRVHSYLRGDPYHREG